MPRHGNILVSRTLCEFFNIDRFSGETTIDIDVRNWFQTFGATTICQHRAGRQIL